MVHEVQGGGYDGTSAPSVTVTVVEDDTQSLAIAGAGAAEGAGVLRFAVTLSLDSDAPVTVEYATGAAGDTAEAGADYLSTSGTLRFPARSTAPRMIEVTLNDDTVDEPDERLTVTLSRPVNAILAGGGETATATGTITDDDALPQVRIAGASVSEGDGTVEFTVTLDRASARTVTVDYATMDDTARADADYTPVSGTLAFAAGQTSRTIAVPVIGDAVDEPDEQFTVTLSAAVDASVDPDGRTATGTINNDDDPPTLRIAGGSTSEGGGVLRVAVTLDAESGRTVTVDYAMADGTATAAADYVQASGTLAFAPGTVAHTIAVTILADAVAEDTETFTVTLRDAHHAELAAAASTATGTITDDDTRGVRVQPTALTLHTGAEAVSYTVVLASQPTDEVTVHMTAEPAAAAFAVTPMELRFTAASWGSTRTVSVSAEADATVGDTVQIRHAVSGGDYANVAASSVTVTVTEPPPLALSALQVTGAGTMYPPFDPSVLHYALTCADSTTVRVTAQASRANVQLTLLRADETDNRVATGSLDAQVTVDDDHDIAIALSVSGDSPTYVVHCIAENFPDIRILKKTDAVSDGLLLVTPSLDNTDVSYMAIVVESRRGAPGRRWGE